MDIPTTGSAGIAAMSRTGRALTGVTIASFGSGDAARVIATVRELLPRCTEFRAALDGGKFSVETTSVPAPRLGDEAFAMAIVTRPASGAPGSAHTATAVRIGDVLVETTHVNLAGPTPELPDEELLRLQIARVKAVQAGKPAPDTAEAAGA